MAILTYKEAAQKLNVTLDTFMRYIYRSEFAEFRCDAEAKVDKTLNSGTPISYKRTCGGVNFTEKFKKIFKTLANRRRFYYGN